MTLPVELASIFRVKQKSYKMVLILAILDEYQQTKLQFLPLNAVAERFLSYFRNASNSGNTVDLPPPNRATSWNAFTLSQTKSLLQTPIDALKSIIEANSETITFKSSVWAQINEQVLSELREYAQSELTNYNDELATKSEFSLKTCFDQILDNYLDYKTQGFGSHPVGALMRKTIPEYLLSQEFIGPDYKVQGSIGQGNWVGIPWIAILDKRLNISIQSGEYIVYLFAEDMSAVYLTLAHGVTEPQRLYKKKGANQYFKQKSEEIRSYLPLENMQKDEIVPGTGDDYQTAIIASIRYDRNHVPEDAQLLSDLENVVNNYKLYADKILQEKPPIEQPVFTFTMAHLYLCQGIVHYLGQNNTRYVPLDELVANQATVLKSGDDVKNPKERVQHIGRAFQELGLLAIEDGQYSLTAQGLEYYQAFDQTFWSLSPAQVELVRAILTSSENEGQPSRLIQCINLGITTAEELGTFKLEQFKSLFISTMNMETEWGEVTQLNRSRFMLNWLEELGYVDKSKDEYRFIAEVEVEPIDTLTIVERVNYISSYIESKGFHFPEDLIENFYLSLKTKPFVILAGVSGTGKTKLVKLFAEALGATSDNKQFNLIPVRPDWSDPSDLLGYKDLTGAFRPGLLAEVLVEASKESNRNKPYFVCLDEMNLARVEHYFSDLLSVIETQEWRNDRIITVPLIQKDGLISEDQPIYGGLALPDNVYIIGTVNMDETTHPFSKKVLDRANTIEFNYINLEQFPTGLSNQITPERVSNSFLRSEYLQLIDAYDLNEDLVKNVTTKLVKINEILEQVHSHVGFRIRDAVCFYMIYNKQFELMSEDKAYDLQLLQKLLPRVQGSSSSVKRVLLQLLQEALGKSLPIQDLMDDASELYSGKKAKEQEAEAKYPFSARKLTFMLRRLEEDGFTSYWLS
ncbi:MrcB family domain-containing protein [Paenibacillus sp. CF384]|uniref:MrcB family domain-containing protein n=1 Tax=Paenibacillus sp. CF384 TaxID=1884382 RepID=UPI0008965C25|nr:DUF3578 domain-containing protein [Paenibacillus sp. CF384]SDW71266.1 AAA domain (dynein-related subfamily) [Paenibacillus sp. CF384]